MVGLGGDVDVAAVIGERALNRVERIFVVGVQMGAIVEGAVIENSQFVGGEPVGVVHAGGEGSGEFGAGHVGLSS